MTLFDWVWDDPDFKLFEAAFNDGRAKTKPSFYWGPIGKQWYELKGPKWVSTPLPVPKVPMPFGLSAASPWNLYPEVKKAGALLAPIYGNALYWDPRTGGWVRVVEAAKPPPPPPPAGPPCLPDMKRKLEQLDQLYKDRTLQEQEWRNQRTIVIEACLGSGPG